MLKSHLSTLLYSHIFSCHVISTLFLIVKKIENLSFVRLYLFVIWICIKLNGCFYFLFQSRIWTENFQNGMIFVLIDWNQVIQWMIPINFNRLGLHKLPSYVTWNILALHAESWIVTCYFWQLAYSEVVTDGASLLIISRCNYCRNRIESLSSFRLINSCAWLQ